MNFDCIILGAGSHARMLIELLERQRLKPCLLDSDSTLWGCEIDGCPVLGNDGKVLELVQRGVRKFLVGVGSIARTDIRVKLFSEAVGKYGMEALTVIDPSAVVSSKAKIHGGCQIMPGAIINRGAVLHENVLVNSGAIVEHDCEILSHSHVASGAVLCGGVRVGECSHIGAGAVIRQGIQIGEKAVIAAGAVVIDNVPDHVSVCGVPARKM